MMSDDGAGAMPVPGWLVEDSRRFAESGRAPVLPRPAATVVLLRPAGAGFEVYAQRRPATMAFAPNMYVFPGGSVDVRDAEAKVGWAGPDPARWGAMLGLPSSGARAVVCAAVREVFEECGVLLAGPDESTVVGDVSGPEWETARQALLRRETALVDVLAERGLAVRSDLLAPWARWVTPEFEPRRYDTFFFVARLPADQRTRDVGGEAGGEAEHACWVTPAAAMRLPMLPPTLVTLRQLDGVPTIEAALVAGTTRDLSPVTPRLHVDDHGAWLIMK
jgi:8-oxo-dGTP pyrophosphatase MutT (NUDIX family)